MRDFPEDTAAQHRRATRALSTALAVIVTQGAAVSGSHAQPSGWLPHEHWTRAAIVRLHALGQASAHDPVPVQQWSDDVQALFTTGAPGARALLQRLQNERTSTNAWFDVEMTGRYVLRDDVVRTGRFTLSRVWAPPVAVPDVTAAGAALHIRVQPVPRVSLTARAAGHGSRYRVEHATIDARVARAHVWAGRRAVGYATGLSGGLVLTHLPLVDGAGTALHAPLHVPLIGGVTAELFGGRVAANGHVRAPWVIGTRLHAALHPRFDAGATRVALFGGMDGARVGIRQVAEVIVAGNLAAPYADDQVASVDARWRPPARLPLELYGEWGMHDIDAGVLIVVPAFTVGVRAPALAGAASLGATIEHTQISGSCCSNPPWYHHFELADGWTMRGTPLGHPLGGHGREWRMAVDATTAALVTGAGIAWRIRHDENLYSPTRAGSAVAADVHADAHVWRRASLSIRTQLEHGDGWNELRARIAGQWRW